MFKMKALSAVQIQRRQNLQVLIDKYGSAGDLALKLGFKTQSRVSHLLGTKGMGEVSARDIEERLGLANGWMDRDPHRPPNLPNAEWLAAIYTVLYKNNAIAQMSKKKLQTIIDLSYEAAAKDGAVDPQAVVRLIELCQK
jgi:hypothetical protein